MNKTALTLAALLALPAMAQDQRVSLVFDQTKHEESTFTSFGTPVTLSMDKTTAIGLRYGIAAAHFWSGALEFEGTIRPRSNEKYLKVNGTEESPANTGGQSIKLSEEYIGIGVGMRWTQVVDFGFMLEARQESTDFTLANGTGFQYTQRTATTRPWLSLHAGYTFPIQAPVKPFVNVAYGFALGKKGMTQADYDGLSNSGFYSSNFAVDFYNRSVLPKSELAIEAGIRF